MQGPEKSEIHKARSGSTEVVLIKGGASLVFYGLLKLTLI